MRKVNVVRSNGKIRSVEALKHGHRIVPKKQKKIIITIPDRPLPKKGNARKKIVSYTIKGEANIFDFDHFFRV